MSIIHRFIQDVQPLARLMIVGEAPGANEAKEGRPFVGYSGVLLDQLLTSAGLRRSEAFVTNVCHVQPPGNKFEWFTKSKEGQEHLMRGILKLKQDLLTVQPNLVLALGAMPLKFLTGKDGISKWRGSVLPGILSGAKVLSTYHPAAILRKWDYKAVVEFDMRKAARQVMTRDIIRPQRDLILNPDNYVELAADLIKAPEMAIDIECWPWSDGQWVNAAGQHRIACIAFSDRPSRAVVFDMISDQSRWPVIGMLLASDRPKIFQNGTFDVTILRQAGFTVRNFAWDTMLAHHACYVEAATGEDELSGKKPGAAALSKGLAFLTSIHTDESFYKDDGKLWAADNDIARFWRYNALDAAVTLEVKRSQEGDLKGLDAEGAFAHSMSLVEPAMAMTAIGIKIDLARRDAFVKEYDQAISNLQAYLDHGAGRPINTSSSKDIPWLLYEKLGLKEQKNRKTGSVTANKDAINKLAATSNNPLLAAILRLREKRTIKERYLNVAIDSDGRMRCAWDITGTKSRRLSSRASLLGSGTNLQNQPEIMREMFIPDEGKVFIAADYSQAEARIVAYLARDQYLIELFNDPSRDIHRETASKIFGKPVADITDDERYVGKRVRHAVNYGMDAKRFVEVVNSDYEETGVRIDFELARKAIEGFFLMHPNHKPVFWGDVQRQIRQSRMIRDAWGFPRLFFGRFDDELLRSAYAQHPQGTIGVLCCKALVACYKEIQLTQPKTGFNLLLNVHDSLVAQATKASATHIAAEMKRCMAIPITIDNHTFTIPTDVMIGMNWRKAQKDGSNAQGLISAEKWLAKEGA